MTTNRFPRFLSRLDAGRVLGAVGALAAALALGLGCGDQGRAADTANTIGDGGSGGTGGTASGGGGTGGGLDAGPDSSVFIDTGLPEAGPDTPRSDKVDLLFVIDNSMSMADKQLILAETIPDLIARMATPDCVNRDPATDEVTVRFGPSTVDGTCAQGELEFRPVSDIHVGVISSSIGGHGSTEHCHPDAGDAYDPSQEDMAHLLDRAPGGATVATLDGMGFLAWDPEARYSAGSADLGGLQTQFADVVRGVGEQGCGFEAPLESVYRFLFDPDPYDHLELDSGYEPPLAVPTGTDTQILEQRANFLRHDSLLAIFTITDENDCSIRDEYSQYYWIAMNIPMPRATSPCAADPNDPCCTACIAPAYPAGCSAAGVPADDSVCQPSAYYAMPDPADHINVRCFDQKRRFGVEYLWPVHRYVDAVEAPWEPHPDPACDERPRPIVMNREGEPVNNPVYCAPDDTCCEAPRDRSFLFWVGIVGVPWQDVAVDPADLSQGLLSGRELVDLGRWDVILGDPAAGLAPTDPHMVESIAPRTGSNPVTEDAILPPDTPDWNPINGHERTLSEGQDLQYACIFPLPESRTCSSNDDKNCDCRPEADPEGTRNPLCQEGADAMPGSEQYYAKAYPSTRVLQVLEGLNPDQVVISSICPANVTDDSTEATDYGYRPVVPPLMDRIVHVLVPR